MTGAHQTLMIRTPEGITFPLDVASPILRFLALAIDQACIYILSALFSVVFSLTGLLSRDVAAGLWMVFSFVLSMGYPIAMEWLWRGQTFGKKILRLQVMDAQGLRLQFSQIVVRNLLRVVDALPAFYLVGATSSLLTIRGQRLGDMAANTIVIRHPVIAEPDLDRIMPDKFNSFRQYPHLAARLRQNVSPQEAGIAFQAVLRREALEDSARLSLFRTVREHMESIVAFPPDVTEGLSDEQYIRNVVDILFR